MDARYLNHDEGEGDLMAQPSFWGWSTGPLTIGFWGWEDASVFKEGFACAPRVAQASRLPRVVLDLQRPCVVAAVESPLVSVHGSYSGLMVASASQTAGICRVEVSQLVSAGHAIPKTRNNQCVEKVVNEKPFTASSVSASPVAACGTARRHVPIISK